MRAAGRWRVGRVQGIWSVAMGADLSFDFLQVNWFKVVEEEAHLKGLLAVKISQVRGGAFEEEEAWVLAKSIEMQVFFSPNPVRGPGWHTVHFKHSSSYRIPNLEAEDPPA